LITGISTGYALFFLSTPVRRDIKKAANKELAMASEKKHNGTPESLRGQVGCPSNSMEVPNSANKNTGNQPDRNTQPERNGSNTTETPMAI
jgi:hypothetical protein